MIGALVALLSLELTSRLVSAGLVAKTVAVTSASNTSPITVGVTAHGFVRPTHAVVAGVLGNDAANGLWVCTPSGPDSLTLSTFDLQGKPVASVGNGSYSGGGTLKTAFPDGSILLGRRNVAMQTAVATPRIVFVPQGSPAWDYLPYGGVIPAQSGLPSRLSEKKQEQQYMLLNRQLVTERQRFEVHVTGAASPPDPDFGDFDATQAVYQTLYAVMWDLISPDRAKVLGGRWSSQVDGMASLDTRGQKWIGTIEIAQPVVDNPLTFIPTSTDGTITVQFTPSPASGDLITIITPEAPL